MKLIVGLGNPGTEYSKTRHNIGFMSIDNLAEKYNITINKEKFGGLYNEININGEKVILLKPQKYINLSGEVIKRYLDFYKVSINDLMIIHDDLDISCGKYKIKYKGSSAGHNGLKDIEKNINTNEYKRIKIGISNNREIETKDYVLGKFSPDEMLLVSNVIKEMPNIIEDFLKLSFENLMNKYNKNK